jgi:hypothetical protein
MVVGSIITYPFGCSDIIISNVTYFMKSSFLQSQIKHKYFCAPFWFANMEILMNSKWPDLLWHRR